MESLIAPTSFVLGRILNCLNVLYACFFSRASDGGSNACNPVVHSCALPSSCQLFDFNSIDQFFDIL